ncbi:MAG: CHAT domain-containing protein [Acidobacteria bacterium]|nr:CHAT domain-containing protein [Acidobacteriota bacterium]
MKLLQQDIESASAYEPKLRRLVRGSDLLLAARSSRLMGRYYGALGENNRALRWMQVALRRFKAVPHRPGEIQCHLALMDMHMRRGSFERASDHGKAISTDSSANHVDLAKTWINFGVMAHRRRQYDRSAKLLEAAVNIVSKTNHKNLWAIALHNLGCVELSRNRFGEAQVHLNHARKQFELLGSSLHSAYVHQTLAEVHSILGHIQVAMNELNAARSLYLTVGDRLGVAYCDLELFSIDISVGNFGDAVNRSDALVQEFQQRSLSFEKATVLYLTAKAWMCLGEPDLADDVLLQARKVFKREKNQHYLALCDVLLAELVAADGHFERASKLIEKARKYFRDKRLFEQEMNCLIAKHRACLDQFGRDDMARIRVLLKRPISTMAAVEARFLVASECARGGRKAVAIRELAHVIALLEETRSTIDSSDRRRSLFGHQKSAYERLVAWLFEWNERQSNDVIAQLLEMTRCRELMNAMKGPFEDTGPPNRLAHELQSLLDHAGHLDRKLSRLTQDPCASAAEVTEVVRSRKACRASIQKTKKSLQDHRRLSLYMPSDVSLSDIQALLPEGTLVLVFFVTDEQIYRLAIDDQKVIKSAIPLDSSLLRDIGYVTQASRSTLGETRLRQALVRLGGTLLPQMEGKQLLIVPHKQLQRFPFGALITNQTFLIEEMSVSICPNLGILAHGLRHPQKHFRRALIACSQRDGDPKAKEASTIASIYPVQQSERFDTKLLASLDSESLFHFAGHSYFDAAQPERSYLELGGDRFFLYQLEGVDIGGAFVNLASCQSGVMAHDLSNELVGFVTHFFSAGACGALGCSWEVDDVETAEWMVHFYESMREMSVREAHQSACRALIGADRSIRSWAGIQLYGVFRSD